MEILYLLIPIAMCLVIVITLAVVWSISSGQYDDLERAAEEILLDDDTPDERNS